ncbi:type 2 lantipeptide synthetase LanM [Luteimonas aquatica]|uniref:type 2 lantipeptide synthetase LanM n=1 Tax=Luteimonas aquatica TaxID=450364 RepID=UPI001F598619|nr:type 2 lantipeptide synthetase LanM [Luteimonas aquatica]
MSSRHGEHGGPIPSRAYAAEQALLVLARPDKRRPRPALPAETEKLLQGLARGRGGGLFPAVARLCREGVIARARSLGGREDAERLAATLASPAFVPFVEMIESLGPWCRRVQDAYRDLFGPGLVGLENADLFAPLIGEAFQSCAEGGEARAGELEILRGGFQAFFERFAKRLRRDLAGGVFENGAVDGPVVALWASPSETHNGQQRVLRLRFAGGAAIAYKPRPADGERIFMAARESGAPVSLFEWINALPPASGPVQLPTLRVWQGNGRDRWTYSWQEWIDRPPQWGTLRDSPRLRLTGTRLAPREAAAYWTRAGALAAACYGFGISDLGEGNLLAGVRREAKVPMPYIVDLEVFSCPLRRLSGTGLIEKGRGGFHHVGFESEPRWCSAEGPPVAFLESRGGALRLHRIATPWARSETRTVVGDTLGNTGYGAYLLPMLRGMFDLWTGVNLHRDALLRHLRALVRGRRVRVLAKFTASYARELERRRGGKGVPRPGRAAARFSREEALQMDRLDVPYFFAPAGGGALSWLDPDAPATARAAGRQPTETASMLPDPAVLAGRNLEFVDLAVLIKDAIEYIHPDLERAVPGLLRHGDGYRMRDAALGVELRIERAGAGSASFDWPQAGRRLTFSWNRRNVRLTPEPLPPPVATRSDVRRQLLRLRAVDVPLRAVWAAGAFRDRTLGRHLDALTAAGLQWLAQVIGEHGWPTRAMVGKRACEFAAQLIQHAEQEEAGLQGRCLRLMTEAAARGEVPMRHVAYLTDAWRLNTGRKQLYGSKFVKRRGRLVPCPIARPRQVDARRRQMGLPPLAEYQRALQRLHDGERTQQ